VSALERFQGQFATAYPQWTNHALALSGVIVGGFKFRNEHRHLSRRLRHSAWRSGQRTPHSVSRNRASGAAVVACRAGGVSPPSGDRSDAHSRHRVPDPSLATGRRVAGTSLMTRVAPARKGRPCRRVPSRRARHPPPRRGPTAQAEQFARHVDHRKAHQPCHGLLPSTEPARLSVQFCTNRVVTPSMSRERRRPASRPWLAGAKRWPRTKGIAIASGSSEIISATSVRTLISARTPCGSQHADSCRRLPGGGPVRRLRRQRACRAGQRRRRT